jgi:copper transport protein
VACDSTGVVREPTTVDTVDDKVFELRFDPPLAGGRAAIGWKVRSTDAHTIEGTFTFTVTAPAVAAPTDQATDPAAGATEPAAPTTSLEDFLATPTSTPGTSLARMGRTLEFLGAVVGIGALAFLATTLRGRRSEVTWSLMAVKVLGAAIAIGAAIEYIGLTRLLDRSLFGAATTSPGVAALLRLLGGSALAFGLATTLVEVRRRRPARALSAAVIEPDLIELRDRRTAAADDAAGIVRWRANQQSWPALAGLGLIVVSFWFDGHTVSKGFRPTGAAELALRFFPPRHAVARRRRRGRARDDGARDGLLRRTDRHRVGVDPAAEGPPSASPRSAAPTTTSA